MSQIEDPQISWRVQGAVYGVGMFSNSSLHLYNVVVPLWAASLTQDELMLGIIFGARHFLPMLLLIHGGSLMDRFGARRVTIIFAVAAMIIPPLYPLLPFISALIVLQMLGGLMVMTCWIGSQSLTGTVMRGKPVYTGRLTVATRIGAFLGPPIVGTVYDFAGPQAAFVFLGVWAGFTLISAAALPKAIANIAPTAKENSIFIKTRVKDVLPRLSDYLDALRLIAIPTIALVMLLTFMRHSGVAMQSNFYVVYINNIGISGTLIGILFSVLGAFGGIGALFIGRVAKRYSARNILHASLAVGVTMIMITPLIGQSGFSIDAEAASTFLRSLNIDVDFAPIAGVLGLYILFLIAMGIRGIASGFSQSMEISLIAQSAGLAGQGKGAALRVTVGRIAAVVLPVIMGAIAKLFGLEMSFYIVGGLILVVLAIVIIRAAKEEENS